MGAANALFRKTFLVCPLHQKLLTLLLLQMLSTSVKRWFHILLMKLEDYGMKGTSLDCFESYLSDRTMCLSEWISLLF